MLANLLLVFEKANFSDALLERNKKYNQPESELTRDFYTALGIGSGYANFVSHMLGYETGYCAGFDGKAVAEELGLNKTAVLMLGIGHRDQNKDIRRHHLYNQKFPPFKKEIIEVNYIK